MNRDDDLNDELRAHLDMAIRDRIARGESPEEARAAARRELGNELLIKEVTRSNWAWTGLERLARDCNYALRQMRLNPGFATIATLTLALGLGATTAIFTVIDSVLLRPLPIDEPDRVGRLFETGRNITFGSVSFLNLKDVQAQAKTLSVDGYASVNWNLEVEAGAERIPGWQVGPRLFDVLGVQPALGRGFRPDEDRPEAAPVVILGDSLWRRIFNADPGILGRAIMLDRQPYTIVGVMPESFVLAAAPVDFYVPLKPNAPQLMRGFHYLRVAGRLAPGVGWDTARKELTEIFKDIEKLNPVQQTGRTATIVPIAEIAVGESRRSLLISLGAVGLLLLIACVNVSNLLLARGAARQREVTIRAALGASRWRIGRQFLIESAMLGLAGGVLGFPLAAWGVHAISQSESLRLPRRAEIAMDANIFLFALGLAFLSALLFGAIPAFRAARVRLQLEHARSVIGGGQRLKNALVVVEVALALILLAGAGLLMRSFLALNRVDSGIQADRVLTLQVSLPTNRYQGYEQSEKFYHPVAEQILALPGVAAAGWINAIPLQSSGINGGFSRPNRPASNEDKPAAEIRVVSPGYFQALGIPFRRGRVFTAADTPSAPRAVIVNQALVDRHFSKDEDPIGQVLDIEGLYTIVGVVANVRESALTREALPNVFLPMSQLEYAGGVINQMSLAIRAQVPPETLIMAIRTIVAETDRSVPVSNVKSMEQIVSDSFSDRRLSAVLFGIFAGVAMILAAAGIYGVLSFLVAERTQEIGVRMALGSTTFGVLRMVLAAAIKPVAIGIVIGLGGALATTRLRQSLLFGVQPYDGITFAFVSILMLTVAIVASAIPARRAASVDPAVALRNG